MRTIELQSDHAEMASDNYNGGAGPTAGYNSTDRFEQTRREVRWERTLREPLFIRTYHRVQFKEAI